MTDIETLRANRRREIDRIGRRRRQLARLNGEPVGLIPVAPIRQRLRQLYELGWSFEAIAAMNGQGSATALNMIASGASFKCERKFAPIADLPYTLHVPNTVDDNMWVPTLGATRRIQALLALGWRHDDITEAIGRASHSLGGGTYLRTRAIDWRIVNAAYERMSAGRGASNRTARRAEAMGYAPPFAWRDIDDPNGKPQSVIADDHLDPVVVQRILSGDWRLPCTPAEKAAVCEEWVERGGSLAELERRTAWRTARYYRKGDAA